MHPAGLERKELIDQRNNSRRVERTAWAIMVLIICAALTGSIGVGQLTKKILGTEEEGFLLEFNTMLRYKQETILKFTVFPQERSRSFGIKVNKAFFKGMATEKIVPEPYETLIGKEDYIFNFLRSDHSNPNDIFFHLKPIEFGKRKLIAGKDGKAPQEMEVFIYP
jgi:hypothetical protein